MKIRVAILIFLSSFRAFGQSDTIIVRDYSKIFITINNSGEIEPVTNYAQVKKAGFFLNEVPEGMLRLCNKNELFVWANGKLIFSLIGCELYSQEELFRHTQSDTLFISLSSPVGFEDLKCEQVIFEELRILKEDVSEPRQIRDSFREFSTIAFIFLIAVFAVYAAGFSGRLNFFMNKTFSLKASSYEFINTAFFGRANITMVVILSFAVAFEILYVNQKVDLKIFPELVTLKNYLVMWLVVTLWILAFFLAKRILIQIISGMFQMKKLRDWQLFDLVNFSGYFILILFIVILWDFVLKNSNESWVISYFAHYFIAILLLFEVWFIIKFVINSSYQKLLIISYLCATELIPSILIMAWFFK
ncbi:MAG: DUF4271 domain-containing protein [Cyclobacteriaceae bacterium]